jgi:NADH:ubiquinone reductase (H+-translocating)
MSNKTLVIVGGGFGGLALAKALKKFKKRPLEIILIDKTNHHLFQPLLYQVATAALNAADIAIPIRETLSKQKNVTVLMGEVCEVNKKEKLLILKNGSTIHFDYLVLSVGARHSYFGNDEWENYAPGLKTLKDAVNLRERLLISFEKAESCDSYHEAEKYLTFVIVGGGPTGVEMAGSIAEIAHDTMIKDFRRIDTSKTKIYLIEGAPRVLGPFQEKLSIKATKALDCMGVEVITNKIVTNISNEGVHIGDDFIPSKTVIWAAGNQASPLLKTLEVPLDRQGRVKVDTDLSIPDHPDIFVIGDAASVVLKEGDPPLPAVATPAMQEGRFLAKIIGNNIPKEKRTPFKYFDKGSMATIGKSKAIMQYKTIGIYGFFAWLLWGFVHLMYLVAYRSRFWVLVEWGWSYFSKQRGARLVLDSVKENNFKDSKQCCCSKKNSET